MEFWHSSPYIQPAPAVQVCKSTEVVKLVHYTVQACQHVRAFRSCPLPYSPTQACSDIYQHFTTKIPQSSIE